MMRLMLRGAACAVRSTPTATQEAFLGIGLLQNSKSVLAARASYQIENAQGVKLVKGTEPRELRSERCPRNAVGKDFSTLPL